MTQKTLSDTVTYTDKNISGGVPLFKGTSIPVYMVLEYLSKGWSVEEMKEVYPTIKQKYIYKFLETLSKSYEN